MLDLLMKISFLCLNNINIKRISTQYLFSLKPTRNIDKTLSLKNYFYDFQNKQKNFSDKSMCHL